MRDGILATSSAIAIAVVLVGVLLALVLTVRALPSVRAARER